MAPILAFDMKTIPDIAGIRLLHHFPKTVNDHDVYAWAMQQRRAQVDQENMPPHLHKVIAISCCLRWGNDRVHVDTIGDAHDDEEIIIAKFFDLLERYTPQLVSWSGFDTMMPILHYRALINGISAARYWDNGTGEFTDSADFTHNQYTHHLHERHCDLKAALSLQQIHATVPLTQLAKLCGFPGQSDSNPQQIWAQYQDGDIQSIRNMCETDAANTYLMFLRFELMRGFLDADSYQNEIKRFHDYLLQLDTMHWQSFCQAWQV